MRQLSFKRHRFPPEIIRHAIWLYARFTLSFRDVEEMLAERGLDVSYETIRRWFLKFGSIIATNLRRTRPRPSDHWHLDEMVIVIQPKRYWLWRAVDNEGEVLDFLVQRKRDAKAARKLMKKLLKKQGFAPTRIVTDKLRSYPSAFRAIGIVAEHDRGLRANNRAENSHQPVRRGVSLICLIPTAGSYTPPAMSPRHGLWAGRDKRSYQAVAAGARCGTEPGA